MSRIPLLAAPLLAAWSLAVPMAAQDSRPSPEERLRARAERYAELREAGDWAELYKLTAPEDRAKLGLAPFLQAYGSGALKVHEAKVVDMDFVWWRPRATVSVRIDAELQPEKLPPQIRNTLDVGDPKALRKTSTIVLPWVYRKHEWYFRLFPAVAQGVDAKGRNIVPPQAPAKTPNRAQQALNSLTGGKRPERPPAPELVARSISRGLPTKGDWRGHPAIGDVNGDGHLDLAASIRRMDNKTPGEGVHVWLGDGGSSWTPMHDGIRRDMGYGGAAFGDVDADGKLDLGFSGHDVQPHLFLNALAEETPTWTSTTEHGIPVGVICADVAIGDFNRDGHADLATLGQFPQRAGLEVFPGDGTGSMGEPVELMAKNFYGSQTRMVDMDGDGHVEVLAATALGPKVWFFDADAETGFREMSNGMPTPEVGGTDLSIDAADLDGDGFKELMVSGGFYRGHPGIRVYRWDGEAWIIWGVGLPDQESYLDAEFADVIPGGTPEIVAAGKWGISIVTMTAPGEFERIGRIAGTEWVWHITTGDVDHDGTPEIVTVGYAGVRVLTLEQ